MTSILLWIYLFGWKSLITFPLWIVFFLVLVEMVKNRKEVLSGIIVLGVFPSIVFLLLNYAGSKTGTHIIYIFPILFMVYLYFVIKSPDTEEK